jgi:hypothetical protein
VKNQGIRLHQTLTARGKIHILYQGTTSVVPLESPDTWALAPEERHIDLIELFPQATNALRTPNPSPTRWHLRLQLRNLNRGTRREAGRT